MSDKYRDGATSNGKPRHSHKSTTSKERKDKDKDKVKDRNRNSSKQSAIKYSQEESTVILDEIKSQQSRKGDNYCADCQARDPRWAVSNIGIFVCIRCSGVHRSIGTHISKVRSINMDRWTEEQLNCMQYSGGNDAVNARYEATLDPGFTRPQTDYDAEIFIREKYVQRKFFVSPKIDTVEKDPPVNLKASPDRTIKSNTKTIYSKAQLQMRAQQVSPIPTGQPQDATHKTFDASLWS
ncbi:hypothetical protein SARC_07016 [Sphaeroforma arctica JP610]|uniref:Arf-GAP domain-containing protein n=1 Tax=Sphaeroforma arctica JP610 TaxID=667725 RepID=A0A0L0FUV6_9EUKA|nr:hypothetical protein SARC_07016 [Sphaeroforma arctica JP610]KNC80625.1 hypothetical protein SARC_07016 [Sphaeroforma arctica JP610]|eukprot:XP_014154527.1 hypothetical protein SARC_07016 [Sphaeroforma arctica JP610]